jgi:uncharacterized protein (DUF2164 family)
MLARAVTQDANAAARVLVKTPDKRLRTLGTDVYNQLAQAYKAQITAKLGAMEHEVQESDGGRCDRQNPLR